MAGATISNEVFYAPGPRIPMDLHTAASLGCVDSVRQVIEEMDNKVDVNEQNKGGWTPLMYAAYSGDHRVVNFLIDEGASVSLQNYEGLTALMLATKCGNTDSAALLIEHCAAVDAVDLQGWTALFHAVSCGHRSVSQLLMENGCQINIKDMDSVTPLMLAAEAGHEMIVKDLLDQGACTSSCSKTGQTARDLAIQNGHVKVKSAIEAHLFLKQNCCFVMKTRSCPMNLPALLGSLGLTKYYPVFEKNDVDLDTFWTLTDEDLKEMGISLLGPRKKITAVIAKWHQNEPLLSSPYDYEFVDKLVEDSKAMQHQLKELTMLFSVEQRLRITAEKQLKKSMDAVKCFSDKVHRNAHQRTILLQILRETLSNFKRLVCCSSAETYDRWNTSSTCGKITNTFQFLDDLVNEMQRNNEAMRFS